MKVRIFQKDDGGVAIIHAAPKSRRKDETEEQWLARVFTKATPEGAVFVDVDKSEIPSERTFRNAWIKNGKSITVDMPKAKEIQIERWRIARKPLLEKLDVEYMIALEQENGVRMSEIKAKKQALRDVTKTDLSKIATPEELKTVWPEILQAEGKP